jgi:hypothetical protein
MRFKEGLMVRPDTSTSSVLTAHHDNKRKIEPRQIKKIHTLLSKLKMPDDEYRYLLSDYWVETSKKLSYSEAQELIGKLEKIAVEKGVWSQYGNRGKRRYEDLKDRHGMASPKQLRKIEAMWKDVSYTHKQDERARALRKFIFRIAGVDDMRMLESKQASKIIEALQNMKHKHGAVSKEHRVYKDRAAYGP